MISCGNISIMPGVGIEVSLQRDIELRFLGARAVIGEVEAFIEQRIDIGGPVVAGSSRECSSMFLTMESARLPCWTNFSRLSFSMPVNSSTSSRILSSSGGGLEHVVQFVGQFRRERREIIDEIQRVLDLVRDAGGELAERGELLGLHQPVLRGAQFVERGGELPGARLNFVEQPHVLDGDDGLIGKGLHQIDLACR